MGEPTYAFTIPSTHDDTALACRIYHPKSLKSIPSDATQSRRELKGAIVAHPYAPLGGSQDDHVVLAITQCLLEEGYILVTFDFRGAGDSEGKTSWSGHPERHDFVSAIGLLIYYMHNLSTPAAPDTLSPVMSGSTQDSGDLEMSHELESSSARLRIILAGYSFGSLILARLPSISHIIQTFESAERGTSASEIVLRARTLAKQTQQSLKEPPPSPRGRDMLRHSSPHSKPKASPVVIGGEETDPTERRRSRDSRRSFDVVREAPHRLKARLHHRTPSGNSARHFEDRPSYIDGREGPDVSVRYLLVSPVLFPMTTTLLSPGPAFPVARSQAGEDSSGFLSLEDSSLVLFGSSDHFTSAKKLKQWAERLSTNSAGRLHWQCFEGANHFWRGDKILEDLQARTRIWVSDSMSS